MTLGKLLNLFPYLQNGFSDSTYLTRLFYRLNNNCCHLLSPMLSTLLAFSGKMVNTWPKVTLLASGKARSGTQSSLAPKSVSSRYCHTVSLETV